MYFYYFEYWSKKQGLDKFAYGIWQFEESLLEVDLREFALDIISREHPNAILDLVEVKFRSFNKV